MKMQSKFRMNRAAKEHGGARAQAHEMQARPGDERDEALEEQIAPGIHDAVSKAREVHITHDHAAGRHHVAVMGEDGMEQHSDHATPEEAHAHAAMAAGVAAPEGETGEYPAGHESARKKKHAGEADAEPDEDDYQAEEL